VPAEIFVKLDITARLEIDCRICASTVWFIDDLNVDNPVGSNPNIATKAKLTNPKLKVISTNEKPFSMHLLEIFICWLCMEFGLLRNLFVTTL
jgi:hypothetical protein